MAVKEQYGGIQKCPACGAPLMGMAAKCEECGYEFKDVEGNSTVKRLLVMLDKIDGTKDSTEGKINRKIQVIQNYPVPNTKNDLLEMLILCDENRESNNVDSRLKSAWDSKTNQLISKVEIMLSDDKDAQQLIKKISSKKEKKKKKGFIILIIIAAILGATALAVSLSTCHEKHVVTSQNEELVNIKKEANDLILKKQYDEAFQKIDEINNYFVTHQLDGAQFKDVAGDIYQKLVIALIREEDLEGAAIVGLDYREKLNNEMEWKDSQIFKILISECEVQNVDDTPLR